MIEVQNYTLAHAAGISPQIESLRVRPVLLRNSRVLIVLTFFSSIAALCIGTCMAILAISSVFPLHTINFDRISAAALWGFGAWLMAMSQVFLWLQGHLMSRCSVLLDSYGVHFKLGATADAKEVFMPWNGIEAVHYKRIPNAQKFMVLGTDTSAVTFTSYSFYRPKRVARLIAERAGVPLLRG